jgi:hypothetical protein
VAEAAFYCVADERYFVGAVALVNSLRLVGHDELVHVLDCGLTPDQRDRLSSEAEVHPAPADIPPWLLKTAAPLEHPAQVMALLDVDMVATRHLGELLDAAAGGDVVVFANPLQRRTDGWGEILGLGPMRRMPYASSAAVFTDAARGREVLGLLTELQSHVDFERTWWRAGESDYPFLYADQDVLNAILATRVPEERVEVLPDRLAATPPFAGLRVADERSLRCRYEDGTEPFFVHHFAVKPWLEPTHHGVYSRLLRRLLVGPDLAIRLPAGDVPAHLRKGPGAWARRARVNARERIRWHVSGGP